MTSTTTKTNPPIPQSFINKKTTILSDLATPLDQYSDKSPKGSIDIPIQELIDEINDIDGLVTTSSCSGRVAVFVEGLRGPVVGSKNGTDTTDDDDGGGGGGNGEEGMMMGQDQLNSDKKVTGGPGGKGGGRWLYVSHERVDVPDHYTSIQGSNENYFTKLCGLDVPRGQKQKQQQEIIGQTEEQKTSRRTTTTIPRLIRLSFSPLILHVLTATLADHARPLLAAAINAGFRESGVQSLAALESSKSLQSGKAGAGTMVAIRTAGLAFETIIGQVVTRFGLDGDDEEEEIMEALVDESYLKLCFEIINERFEWNEGRKERLRDEIRRGFGKEGDEGKEYESKEDRRNRKREEGLKRQAAAAAEKKRNSQDTNAGYDNEQSENGSGLFPDI